MGGKCKLHAILSHLCRLEAMACSAEQVQQLHIRVAQLESKLRISEQ